MSQDRLYKTHIWTIWRLVNNLDLLVFKPLCDSCFSVSNCDTGSSLPCYNRRLLSYVFDSDWNYLRLQLVRFSYWTSYVQSPWPLTCMWLRACGVVHTLHIEQCEKMGWTHDTMCPDVMHIVFIRAALIIEIVFLILSTHVSNYLFLLWVGHVLFEVLIILNRMSKYILSESLIDQQYRTSDILFKVSDHCWNQHHG